MCAMTRLFAFSCALLACTLCNADTIYQSTDKNGNPVFTDQPAPSAKPIELKPVNTTPAVEPTPGAQPSMPSTFNKYESIKLGVPSSIPNGLAPVAIGIELQPALQPGHRWQLFVDGNLQDQGTQSSVTIDRLERGQHQFQLQVFDANGALIGSSPSTEVFVYWPGKNR
jgi:hypothetical protein